MQVKEARKCDDHSSTRLGLIPISAANQALLDDPVPVVNFFPRSSFGNSRIPVGAF